MMRTVEADVIAVPGAEPQARVPRMDLLDGLFLLGAAMIIAMPITARAEMSGDSRVYP